MEQRKCNKCEAKAVAEIEMSFRSIKVKIPKCEKHLKEYVEKMEHFREIHDIITKG